MHRKLTITLDEKVYEGLHKVIGRGSISQFIESLVRPHVMDQALEDAYQAMSKDKARETTALEWAEGTLGDIDNDLQG